MITPVLIQLFEEGLNKLTEEMNAYPDDASMWLVKEGINNSGGNLCLHLTGNLQHFLGSVLNDSGYVRNREAEFKVKNIVKGKLLNEIEEARKAVKDTLEQVSKRQLDNNYPLPINGEMVNTEYFLVYLLSHLNYHIGQINYHRRLVGQQPA
ncbi:DinB family protein [Paraflavitalea pollutisoli]|uniref:DinB family protein n=1 Tax=Paraflavitalea pollutisoli TaxID=3034143 RepID=UPI0023EB3345|nr:DinB family protein [Paraflavitalea sp. H1-2-19X]